MKLPQNSWFFNLFSVEILRALYFIQKYIYQHDEKLGSETEQNTRKRTRRKPTITEKIPKLVFIGHCLILAIFPDFTRIKLNYATQKDRIITRQTGKNEGQS